MSLRSVALCLCAFLLPSLASAQEFRGTLSGHVLDPQGSSIPNAKLLATENETGARFQSVTNTDGTYVLPFLPPGPYTLTAEAPGFKKYVNGSVRVSTNEREQLDIKLEVGTIDQSVTVSAEGSMLETATASTGQVINTRQIENMPINGRAPLVLAQLAYGVTPNSDPKFARPFDNAGPSGFSMGGGPNQSNELLIDGSPDTTRNSRVAYNPPPDAVQNQGRDVSDGRRVRPHCRRHGERRYARRHQPGPRQPVRVQSDQELRRDAVLHEQGGRQEVFTDLQSVGLYGGRSGVGTQGL